MRLAPTGRTADGQPVLDYEATYPDRPGRPASRRHDLRPPHPRRQPASSRSGRTRPPSRPPSRPNGLARLTPPAGVNLPPETFAYAIDTAAPTGFTLTGTGVPRPPRPPSSLLARRDLHLHRAGRGAGHRTVSHRPASSRSSPRPRAER